MNFLKELEWRGMLHDIMPDTDTLLDKEMVTAYVGIDPTADSLHIGHLVSLMMLKHLQLAGHKPIVVLGGATGMVGDPSGKSKERNLLDEKTLRHNENNIKTQIDKFLDFSNNKKNKAEVFNNYDWTKNLTFLEFVRDIGKHLTVNYMMAKDSVKKRLRQNSSGEGMSFTEFSYQLLQGYDFLYLYKNHNCKLQMGGSDQWGNITTGTELIRRKTGGEAFAVTCPLITKADGGKFGKTEQGNIWLDPTKTSPYKFYQFWLNTSDEDAKKYIKIFTVLSINEINDIIKQHDREPHRRILQQKLAEEITILVHSKESLEKSIQASSILFGKSTSDALEKIDEETFLSVFEGVPMYDIDAEIIKQGADIFELLCNKTNIFSSKGELRRLIKGNGLSINKEKFQYPKTKISNTFLINGKYILIQKGKKQNYIIRTTG
ncbi:MAG: tyrosine--tRNA ligase [Bacteroidota bacterium]|nr:tyrosine--tRNA ligase [Bacteroidota bacterium]